MLSMVSSTSNGIARKFLFLIYVTLAAQTECKRETLLNDYNLVNNCAMICLFVVFNMI